MTNGSLMKVKSIAEYLERIHFTTKFNIVNPHHITATPLGVNIMIPKFLLEYLK